VSAKVISFVSITSIGWKLLPTLGEFHVFDPLLAAILNQRERQGVLASAAKLVDARAEGSRQFSPLFEIASVVVCFNHVASFIVKANHSITVFDSSRYQSHISISG